MTHDLLSSLTSYGFFRAAITTLWLTFVAQAAGTVGGMLLAPLRMSRHRTLRAIASAYLLLFRGTPELLQLIAWYAVVPLAGIKLNLVEIAVVGLGANEAARMAEIIRAGFQAIDDSQRQASRVLGLSRTHTLINVLLPQAARTVVAALGNEINIMFKTTSLASVIGITELLRQSQLVAETSIGHLSRRPHLLPGTDDRVGSLPRTAREMGSPGPRPATRVDGLVGCPQRWSGRR
jgi:polar amino acid transport system permease protein